MKRTNESHILATTRSDGYTYEDYIEYCDGNNIPHMGKESEDYLDWLEEEAGINYEEDLENIRIFAKYNLPVLISGYDGLWDGKHCVAPTKADSVYDAIKRITSVNYHCIIDIEYEDGEINVYLSHHDGTNVYTINALSAHGLRKTGNWTGDDTKKLPYLYD